MKKKLTKKELKEYIMEAVDNLQHTIETSQRYLKLLKKEGADEEQIRMEENYLHSRIVESNTYHDILRKI